LSICKTSYSMGFFTELISATVKTAITPVAIVKDVVNVIKGEEPEATKELLKSASKDLDNATDELADGNML